MMKQKSALGLTLGGGALLAAWMLGLNLNEHGVLLAYGAAAFGALTQFFLTSENA